MKLTALRKGVRQNVPALKPAQNNEAGGMRRPRRHLLTATCFFSVSSLLLTCPAPASSSVVFGSPRNLPADNRTASQRVSAHPANAAALVEEFSFLIKDFKIDHQGEINNLNITVRYRYVTNISDADYPDFRPIAKDIEDFLTNYPNETDYWEIMNKKITAMVLAKYLSIVAVKSEMQVSPSALDPYTRSSIVTRRRRRG